MWAIQRLSPSSFSAGWNYPVVPLLVVLRFILGRHDALCESDDRILHHRCLQYTSYQPGRTNTLRALSNAWQQTRVW